MDSCPEEFLTLQEVVPDPNPTTIPTPPFVFGAKSQQRLINATSIIWYYDTIGQNITARNL